MKNKYIKTTFLFLILIILFVGITTVSATDNNVSSDINTQDTITHDTNVITEQTNDIIKQDTKIITNDEIEKKSTEKTIIKNTTTKTKSANEPIINEEKTKKDTHMNTWGYSNARVGELFDYQVYLSDEDDNPITGAEVIFKFNNDVSPAEDQDNGYYAGYYTFDTIGINNLTVTFAGNDYYNNCTLNVTIDVRKKLPNGWQSISSNKIQLGETVTISGDVYAPEDYSYYVGKTIAISLHDYYDSSVNNRNFTITVDENAHYSYELTPEEIGEYEVTIVIREEEDYDSYETSFMLNVVKEKVVDIAAKSETYYVNLGEPAIITGYLYDKEGNKIPNQKFRVSYYDEEFEKTFEITSDEKGEFVINNITSETPKVNWIYISYLGTEEYAESSTYVWLDFVKQENTVLTIGSITPEEDDSITYRSSVIVTGTLKDSKGNPLQNKYIYYDEMLGGNTDENGEYSFTFIIDQVGLANITVYFDGDESYKKANATKTVEVDKDSHEIYIHWIDNVKINQTVSISGSFASNVSLTLFINNENVGTVHTDEDGRFSYEHLASIAGENNVTVKFDGNDYYNPTNATDTFYVYNIDTSLTVDEISEVDINTDVIITGKLVDELDNPIANAEINISIEGNKLSALTNSNGVYSLKYKVLFGGYTSVNVNYDGDEIYGYSTAYTGFNVNDDRQYVEIILIGLDNYYQTLGETVEVRVYVSDGDNKLDVKSVILQINGINHTVKRNSEGDLRYNLTWTELGEVTVKAVYEGNETHQAVYSQSSVEVLNGKKSGLDVESEGYYVDYGEKAIIKGHLYDYYDDVAIPNQKLLIYDGSNKVLLGNVTTSSNGTYRFEFIPNSMEEYYIKVIFEGTDKYSEAESSCNFMVVEREVPILTIDSITGDLRYHDTITINGTFVDSEGNPIYSYVTYYDDGSWTEDGKYSITTIAQDVGNVNLTVDFSGDSQYKKVNASKLVSIGKGYLNISHLSASSVFAGDYTRFEFYVSPFINNEIPLIFKINNKTVKNITFYGDYYDDYYLTNTSEIGNNTLTLEYEGNKYFYPATYNTTFMVSEKESIITVDNIPDVNLGDTVVITGKLTDADENPIPHANITMNINEELINVITDNKGKYSLNYTVFLNNNNVYVYYEGNITYASSGDFVYFGVLNPKQDIYMVLIVDEDEHTFNDVAQISVVLYDEWDVEEIKYIAPKGKVTLMVNGQNFTLTADKNNTYKYNLTCNKIGEINLRSFFEGNDEYAGAYDAKTLNVIEKESNIVINNIKDVKYGDKIIITGKVTDIDEKIIRNANITLNINGYEVNVKSDKNGLFNYTTTANITGLNKINAQFNDYGYIGSDYNTTFKVLPKNTKISIDTIPTTTVEKTVTITGKLTSNDNKNIANANITLNINNNKVNVKTDTNGIYIYNYTTNTVGTNNILVSYNGDNNYIASNTTTKFTVNKKNTILTINKINDTTYTDKVTITGKLTTTDNKAISKATVNIKINNKILTATTDNQGVFTVTTTAELIGTNNITASYQGNTNNNVNTTTTTFKVVKLGTILTINKVNDLVYEDNIVVTGKLVDANGKSLVNANINLVVGGSTVKVTTNNNGVFTYVGKASNVGSNVVVASYAGDNNYVSSNATTKFTVNKKDTKITINPISTVKVGENTNIKGTLKTEDNVVLKDTTISLNINNNKYPVKTNAQGVFTVPYKTIVVGTNNVTVTYVGDNKYTASNAKTTFKVEQVTPSKPTETTDTDKPVNNTNITKQNVKLVVDQVNGIIGENIVLTAHLTDEKGNSVSGGNVVFKLNGKTLRSDGRFDSSATAWKFKVTNGIVTVTIKADLYLRNVKNLTASYSGSYQYEEAKSNTVTAQIKKRDAKLTVTTSPVIQKQYNTITFTAKLTDTTPNHNNNTAMSTGTKVIFKINGKTIKDSKGKNVQVKVVNNTATYKYTVPQGMGGFNTEGEMRNYTVDAVLVSDTYYPDTRNNTYFNVERSPITINITNVSVNQNNQLSVQATIKDYKNNKVIGNNIVSLKINGKSYVNAKTNKTQMFTVANGTVNLKNLQVNKNIKIKKVMVVTGARKAYLGQRNETSKIVKA